MSSRNFTALEYFFLIDLRVTLAFVTYAASESPGCPDIKFIGCLFRLRSQRVPFEKNMINVVFGVKSEARLIHTCKVYSETMPCFRDKILECGNQKQRKLLHEVSRLLMFMCSPFSLPRQKSLIRHQQCIGNILNLPATTGCTPEPFYQHQLQACRNQCSERPSDFICIMKTWVTEQNLCMLDDINTKCGSDAAKFYLELQVTVFEPMFPVICELPPNYELNLPSTSTVPPSTIIVASANVTRPPIRFSKLAASDVRNKVSDGLQLPEIVWNGMPHIIPTKDANALIPVKENFPPQKLAFATFLSNVFPANVTQRFISYNYSSSLPSQPVYPHSRVEPQSLPPVQNLSTLEPVIIPRHNMPVTRLISMSTTTVAPITPSIRIFSAKPRFSGRSYLSRHSSAVVASIDNTTRPWKPWYLGGGTPLSMESKRKLPFYHGLK
ncbi:hypothetical protein QR680_001823 [Steinernema hermaphroditum]|uniref:Chondroitin proteoglycan 4 domain-containing protein n=1 Tax=Steinernema hermaphroditum TaxID=289476 RepID=A0AA39LGW4_9BILA|nr:hypothetical protein QR680_001823 [Steinernema hermaphroditum]